MELQVRPTLEVLVLVVETTKQSPRMEDNQEWLTNVAGWTFIAAPRDGVSKALAHIPRGNPKFLVMKNGLPYLSKELFWKAMQDNAAVTTLVSGHPWPELREMIREQVQQARPQIFTDPTC